MNAVNRTIATFQIPSIPVETIEDFTETIYRFDNIMYRKIFVEIDSFTLSIDKEADKATFRYGDLRIFTMTEIPFAVNKKDIQDVLVRVLEFKLEQP